MKVDKTVKKETLYIAAITLILSLLMQSVFLIIGKWELSVLFGNVLGFAAAVGNFFVMGLFVQKAVTQDEKDAKSTVRASQSLRTVALFAVAAIGALVSCFNVFAVIIPLFFPRIAVSLRPLMNKKD